MRNLVRDRVVSRVAGRGDVRVAGQGKGVHGVFVTRLYVCRETDAREGAQLKMRVPEDQYSELL